MSGEKWRYARASVIGAAHLNQETECQDRMFCDVFEKNDEEILIAAISDGAGSTTNGQIGAEIACETFAAEIKALLQSADASIKSINEDFGKQWLAYFQKKIEVIAQENEKPVRDYASTFIGAVVGKSDAAFFQVGDGAVVYTSSESVDGYQFGVEANESEYMNMTDFLTDVNAADNLQFKLIEKRIEDLILFSDGIYPIAINYQTGQPHEPFFSPMLAPLRNGNTVGGLNEKLENFLSSSKVNEKTDDDKTIILASRHKIRGDS